MNSILLVEDSPEIHIMLKGVLNQYQITSAATLQEARAYLRKKKFTLIILDLELPDGNGIEILSQLQKIEACRKIPVIIMTADSKMNQKLLAFSSGADDYIVKPFDPMELAARIQVRIQKANETSAPVDILKSGPLILNSTQQKFSYSAGGKTCDVELTSLEFRLLSVLARNRNKHLSRGQLIEQVWDGRAITVRTVDSHVSHLRKKLKESSMAVKSVAGRGYRLVDHVEQQERL